MPVSDRGSGMTDPASSVFSWIPAFAGMTALGYLIAGVISKDLRPEDVDF